MNSKPKTVRALMIVGRGRVGRAFATAAETAGIEVRALCHRELATTAEPSAAGADLALLTVPDREIAPVCARLIESGRRPAVVAHCSGATGLGALAPAAAAGLGSGGLHPLQTFGRPGTGLA